MKNRFYDGECLTTCCLGFWKQMYFLSYQILLDHYILLMYSEPLFSEGWLKNAIKQATCSLSSIVRQWEVNKTNLWLSSLSEGVKETILFNSYCFSVHNFVIIIILIDMKIIICPSRVLHSHFTIWLLYCDINCLTRTSYLFLSSFFQHSMQFTWLEIVRYQ